MRILKLSHSAENVKETLWLFHIKFVPKYQKIEGGDFGDNKNFRKKSHSAEIKWKGDPLVSSGFVCYI